MSLSSSDREAIRELLAGLEHDVPVRLDLGPSESPVTLLAGGGRELEPGETTRAVVEEICGLAGRVQLEVVEHAAPGPYPRTGIGERIAFLGTPWGYELTSLVHGIAETGRSGSSLAPASLEALACLDRDVLLEVYVTPT
ncbi:MAG: hypothetical protein FJW96_04545 [Actinobacteria bacterium]|nr:hypothetical protein [Actinomycetota bacterium]